MTPQLQPAGIAPVRLLLLLALVIGLFAGTLTAATLAAGDADDPAQTQVTADEEEGSDHTFLLELKVSDNSSEDGHHEETEILLDVHGVHGGGAFEFFHPITVGSEDTMKDDVVSVGGDVEILGEVRGDVVVICGTLKISGRVEGDVVAILTDTEVMDTSVIDGQFVHIGGMYEVSPLATVHGERVHLDVGNFSLGSFISELDLGEEAHSAGIGLLRCIYAFRLIKLGVLFGLMLLIVGLIPQRVIDAGGALPEIWGRSIFMGLLAYASYFVLMCIFILLCFVLIGIPLVGILGIAWIGVKAFGLAAILRLLGDRIAQGLLRRDVKPMAALSIGFLVYLPTQIMPFYWGIVAFSLSVLGSLLGTALLVLSAGLALVTQFGAVTTFAPAQPSIGPPASPPPTAPPAPAENS